MNLYKNLLAIIVAAFAVSDVAQACSKPCVINRSPNNAAARTTFNQVTASAKAAKNVTRGGSAQAASYQVVNTIVNGLKSGSIKLNAEYTAQLRNAVKAVLADNSAPIDQNLLQEAVSRLAKKGINFQAQLNARVASLARPAAAPAAAPAASHADRKHGAEVAPSALPVPSVAPSARPVSSIAGSARPVPSVAPSASDLSDISSERSAPSAAGVSQQTTPRAAAVDEKRALDARMYANSAEADANAMNAKAQADAAGDLMDGMDDAASTPRASQPLTPLPVRAANKVAAGAAAAQAAASAQSFHAGDRLTRGARAAQNANLARETAHVRARRGASSVVPVPQVAQGQ